MKFHRNKNWGGGGLKEKFDFTKKSVTPYAYTKCLIGHTCYYLIVHQLMYIHKTFSH